MTRTSNPYETGRSAFTGWAKGYKAHRNGEARASAVVAYISMPLRVAWREGWDASRADVKAEEVGSCGR